jgi:hypothetical protein
MVLQIPDPPTYVEDTLEESDQILVIWVRATDENAQKLIIASVLVGSAVRLTARKTYSDHQLDTSLRRQ